MGTVATWTLLFDEFGSFADWLSSILNLVLAAVSGFGAALVLAIPLTWWWLRRYVRAAEGTLKEAIEDVAAATQAAVKSDVATAMLHAKDALQKAIDWYGPIATRRFMVQTALGVVVTFGGLVGTGLLFRQTLLLGKQNEKLDLQTVTAEAQRRAGLQAELFSILQTVSQLTPPCRQEKNALELPPGLAARVVALSRAATRYWIVEVPDYANNGKVPVPRSADRPRSPERGQLLAGLVAAGVYVGPLSWAGATFDDADLRDTRLEGADLRGVSLSRADLRGTYLNDAKLAEILLFGADLTDANLNNADLAEAQLSGANLRGARLIRVDLAGAYLRRGLSGISCWGRTMPLKEPSYATTQTARHPG